MLSICNEKPQLKSRTCSNIMSFLKQPKNLPHAFLPRVVELATTSSERQTKVAACELLHSLVLLTLGRGALQPPSAPGRQQQQQHSMHALYRHVLPAILKLACDVDEVGRAHCDVLSVSAQSTPVITKA